MPSDPTTSRGDDPLATALADLTARLAALEGAGPFWPGCIGWTAGDTAPPGWLVADGSAFDTARYAALSAALGGASTLPDLRDKFPVGAGNAYTLLATGGGTTASIALANLPSHSHTITGPTGSTTPGSVTSGAGSAHFHGATSGSYILTGGVGALAAGGPANFVTSSQTASESAHTHSVAGSAHTHTLPANTGAAGSGTALDITNPYIALTPLIHI